VLTNRRRALDAQRADHRCGLAIAREAWAIEARRDPDAPQLEREEGREREAVGERDREPRGAEEAGLEPIERRVVEAYAAIVERDEPHGAARRRAQRPRVLAAEAPARQRRRGLDVRREANEAGAASVRGLDRPGVAGRGRDREALGRALDRPPGVRRPAERALLGAPRRGRREERTEQRGSEQERRAHGDRERAHEPGAGGGARHARGGYERARGAEALHALAPVVGDDREVHEEREVDRHEERDEHPGRGLGREEPRDRWYEPRRRPDQAHHRALARACAPGRDAPSVRRSRGAHRADHCCPRLRRVVRRGAARATHRAARRARR
jgi:hypothetical protein